MGVGTQSHMFCCTCVNRTYILCDSLSWLRGRVEYLYSSNLLHWHERYMVSQGIPDQLGDRNKSMSERTDVIGKILDLLEMAAVMVR